jgi:hypothetical protein
MDAKTWYANMKLKALFESEKYIELMHRIATNEILHRANVQLELIEDDIILVTWHAQLTGPLKFKLIDAEFLETQLQWFIEMSQAIISLKDIIGLRAITNNFDHQQLECILHIKAIFELNVSMYDDASDLITPDEILYFLRQEMVMRDLRSLLKTMRSEWVWQLSRFYNGPYPRGEWMVTLSRIGRQDLFDQLVKLGYHIQKSPRHGSNFEQWSATKYEITIKCHENEDGNFKLSLS